MKNIKVLGLALVASIIAAPAFAGETYVRNDWSKSTGVTETNLYLDSQTNSTRNEKYDTHAAKVSYGDTASGGNSEHDIDYQDVSVHAASSNLWGNFTETNSTSLSGTIDSVVKTSSFSHETSGGVR